jgi:hypothetical protein
MIEMTESIGSPGRRALSILRDERANGFLV